jgi:hypothetical protein
MCGCLVSYFKNKDKDSGIIKNNDKNNINFKRPGPIITDVVDFTTVSKEKKKYKYLIKFVGQDGI